MLDTSASGDTAPSTRAKIGSVPLVWLKRWRISAAEIVQPSAWRWQELHERPLLPRLWKNGLPLSMLPLGVLVCSEPEGSAVVSASACLAGGSILCACATPMPANRVAAATAIKRRCMAELTVC